MEHFVSSEKLLYCRKKISLNLGLVICLMLLDYPTKIKDTTFPV